MSKQGDRDAKEKHEKWLRKQGVHPEQLKAKRSRIFLERDRRRRIEANTYVPKRADLPDTRGDLSYQPSHKRDKPVLDGVVIAPAYNKGPYQVIHPNNVKDIGK